MIVCTAIKTMCAVFAFPLVPKLQLGNASPRSSSSTGVSGTNQRLVFGIETPKGWA